MLWVRRVILSCRTARLLFLALVVLVCGPQPALAATVGDPIGNVVNGWYKDSFTIDIRYGNGNCTREGKANKYTFTAGAPYEGTHDYHFLADLLDNPYLAIDNSPPFLLISPPPCPTSFPVSVRDFNSLRLDVSPPSVSLTDPAGNITTAEANYRVVGEVGDSASGIASVKVIVNGVTGPLAAVGGSAYSTVVSLGLGQNTITAVASDLVGHESVSNSVVITRVASSGGGGGGGGGSSPGSGNTGSAPTAPSISSQNQSAGAIITPDQPAAPRVAALFSPDLPQLKQASANVAEVAKSPDLGSRGIRALAVMLLLLLVTTGVYIWLAPRLPGRQGLRRKIIMTVILPALVPLVAMGIAGYQQLSESVRSSLSDQLAKASSATALKLEREFDIRQTVFISTASSIIQLKNHYNSLRSELAHHKDNCAQAVKTLIPRGRSDQVISNPDCTPFLAGFARLATPGPDTVNDYLTAVNSGHDQALADLNRADQERTDQSLRELKLYFPETLDVAVVDSSEAPRVIAALPTGEGDHLLFGHSELFALVQRVNLSKLVTGTDSRHLIMGYPVSTQGGGHLGAVLVAYNPDHTNFIRPTWQVTPKPHADDSVLIVDDDGQLIYPRATMNAAATTQLKAAVRAKSGAATALRLGNQDFTARASAVGGTNWAVLVAASAGSVLKPLVGIQLTALLSIGVSVLLALVLGYVFASAITRQLAKLTAGAEAFAAGQFDYRITSRSHDELETLAETMNQMAGKIKTAEDALVEKDKEFIYVATHELRAPLTAVIGNLSLLQDGDGGKVDPAAVKIIDQAFLSAQRLRDLVNDLLDIARLDAGKTDFDLKPQNLAQITRSVVDMQEVVAKSQKIKLLYETPPSLPAVLADENKLKIVLTNLVSNAIKYNRPRGSVSITQAVKGKQLVTTVTDTGLGIPADQQGRIFEKFFRVKASDRQNITGTGLGMHITKRIVEAMGGKIGFKSEPGQGTSFYFSLPLAATSALSAKAS